MPDEAFRPIPFTPEEAEKLLGRQYSVRQVEGMPDIVRIQTPFRDFEGKPVFLFAGRDEEAGDGFIVDDGGVVIADMAERGMSLTGSGMRRIRRSLWKDGVRNDIRLMRDLDNREWLQRHVDSLSGAAFYDFLMVLVILANAERDWATQRDRPAKTGLTESDKLQWETFDKEKHGRKTRRSKADGEQPEGKKSDGAGGGWRSLGGGGGKKSGGWRSLF
jgi:hypothetical protein